MSWDWRGGEWGGRGAGQLQHSSRVAAESALVTHGGGQRPLPLCKNCFSNKRVATIHWALTACRALCHALLLRDSTKRLCHKPMRSPLYNERHEAQAVKLGAQSYPGVSVKARTQPHVCSTPNTFSSPDNAVPSTLLHTREAPALCFLKWHHWSASCLLECDGYWGGNG